VANRDGVHLSFKGQIVYQKGLSSVLNLQKKSFQNSFKLTTDASGNEILTEPLASKHQSERK
jgi:hypothetical protein